MNFESSPNPFNDLQTVGMNQYFNWIQQLKNDVSRVVSFGCVSSEPYALFLHLSAIEICVVEIDYQNLIGSNGISPKAELVKLCRLHPRLFTNSSVKFIIGDLLSSPIQSGLFDLAFCRNVLYYLESDSLLKSAVREMSRVIRPDGYIIAIEPKINVDHHLVETNYGRIPVPDGEPKDISHIFESLGFFKVDIPNKPSTAYCYQKIIDSKTT